MRGAGLFRLVAEVEWQGGFRSQSGSGGRIILGKSHFSFQCQKLVPMGHGGFLPQFYQAVDSCLAETGRAEAFGVCPYRHVRDGDVFLELVLAVHPMRTGVNTAGMAMLERMASGSVPEWNTYSE